MTAPDLFTFAGWAAPALPESVRRSLLDYERRPPPWPAPPGVWHAIVADVRQLADRWHRVAVGQGWTMDDLYGLDATAPRARLDRMGAFWLIASRRDQVICLDREAISLKTRSGAVLRLYRRLPGGARR
jgi:hypothetical protein